jgi:AraC-like DNA-binding protein
MEKVEFDKNCPVIVFSYRIPNELDPLHLHDCMEIGLVAEGEGEFHIDNKVYPYKPGDLFLINKIEAHRAKSLGKTKSRFFFIYISDLFFEMVSTLSPSRNYFSLYTLSGRDFNNHFRNGPIQELVRRVHDEFYSENSYRLEIVKALSAELVVLLLRQFSRDIINPEKPVADTFGASLLKVYDYINDHLEEKISIDKLADTANLSPSHFRKLFRQYSGKSPVEYIHTRRLKQAYIYIVDKKMPPLQAAYQSGFSSYSFFQKLFKKEFGISPKAAKNS